MEPTQGTYDFSMIDNALKTCSERGQTLAVRLMAFGATYANQPSTPKWYRDNYPMINDQNGKPLVPDHNAPAYFEHWGKFVREFAKRYDANDMLESIDVTFIGPWGEGAGEISQANCDKFADLWQDAFVHTPRLVPVAGIPGECDQFRSSIDRGSGWRADCFGDVCRNRGNEWTPRTGVWQHMYSCYPRRVAEAGAQNAWKTQPVHFETCWVPMMWYRNGMDIDFIIQQGLKYHMTYFMPKSTALPEPWMDKLADFCRRMGYRFVIRFVASQRRVAPGGRFILQTWIENIGCAPIYRKYDLALRLRQGDTEEIITFDDIDIRTWLPGDIWLDKDIDLPAKFRPGCVELSLGIIDPKTKQPKVNFAVEERYNDRWACMGHIEVRADD